MRTRRRFGAVAAVLAAILLVNASPRGAAGAEATAAAGDSVASASPSGATAAPSAAELATLRARVGQYEARVRVGADLYDVRGARFDSSGVTFAPGDARGVARWERYGRSGALALPQSLGSPVGWDRIEGIAVRKSSSTRGATIGGVIGGIGYLGLLALFMGYDSAGMAPLVLLPLPAITAVIGAVVGSAVHREEPVWERAVTAPARR